MRWLADECVSALLVVQLRAAGHDVTSVAEEASRTEDEAVLELAASESRLLITEDKDFGELVFRQARRAPGIVLLRIDPSLPERRWERLRMAIEQLGEHLFDHYTVVEMDRLRSRPLLHTT